jgi:uncharacterized protein YggU (UPF0235/DUF167 family)
LRLGAKGLTVELSVQPRARREALELRDGALRAVVTAPAEQGKANEAVIALVARTWRLPKSAFAVARGASARHKVLSVGGGDPEALAGRIVEWTKGHG